MNSNFETFTDLLIEISNEVLINRPCLVSRFISRLLDSYLDRRTLWEMQMASYNMEPQNKPSMYSKSRSVRLDTKISDANLQSHMAGSLRNSRTISGQFIARDSYLAHLSKRCSPTNRNSKSNNSNLMKDGDKYIQTNAKTTLPSQTSDDLEQESEQVCLSDRVKRLYKEKDNDNVISIKTIKNKLNSRNGGFKNGEVVYEEVLNSINVLIDIEKDPASNTGCQVLNLLKKSSDKLKITTEKISGVEEASCLKPSVFRKFESNATLKNFELNNKFRKLKVYKKSKLGNSTSSKTSNVSNQIANFSRMEQLSKKPPNLIKAKFLKDNTPTTSPRHFDKKPLATIPPTPKSSMISSFTPETFSTPSPSQPPTQTNNSPFYLENTPALSPVPENTSSTNISSEFEFNKRLINSSAECLLVPLTSTDHPHEEDISPIADENDILLKKLAYPISSSSSVSLNEGVYKSIMVEDKKKPTEEIVEVMVESLKDQENVPKQIIPIHEAPESSNFFPSTNKLSRFLISKRKNKKKSKRDLKKVSSESRVKLDDWKEYRVKSVSESLHDLFTGHDDHVPFEDHSKPELNVDLYMDVKGNSDEALDSLQTTMPASTIFPLDLETSPTASMSAHKWSDGLDISQKEIRETHSKSQTWASDYYRTTWIVSSNTSIGLADEDKTTDLDPINQINFDLKTSDPNNSDLLIQKHGWQEGTKQELMTSGLPPINSGFEKAEDDTAKLIDICCEGLVDDVYPENAKLLTESLRKSGEKVNKGGVGMGGNKDDVYCEVSGKQKKKRKKGKKKMSGIKGEVDKKGKVVGGCVVGCGCVVGGGCVGGVDTKKDNLEMLETDV